MADLGDISGFMHEGSGSGALTDLNWLDVNEKDYRELDTLPKQNLDLVPDLLAVWSHEDKPASSYMVPNTNNTPRTMGDMSEAHGKLASETIEQVRKVARFALMQSTNTDRFKATMFARFDKGTLREARTVLAEVLAERGLVGKWYIEANDFHACGKQSKKAEEFVRRFASEARYIVAKPGCPTCLQKVGTVCSTFQKQVVLEVPYTEALADRIEQTKRASGMDVTASVSNPRERIRAAFLSEALKLETVQTPKPVVNPVQFMQATTEVQKIHLPMIAQQAAVIQAQMTVDPSLIAQSGKVASTGLKLATDKMAFDVTSVLRREMLKGGRSEKDLVQSLKLSFTMEEIQATRPQWEPLFKEAGFYGTVYSTQESFDDCHEGADFIAKHNGSLKVIVAGVKCGSCIYNKVSRCMMYGKPLLASAEDAMTPEMVDAVIRDQQMTGKLANGAQNTTWGTTPREALKNVYRVASAAPTPGAATRMTIEKAFHGLQTRHVTAGLTKREIVKTASKYLNEGLYGRELIAALRRSFDPRDILASKEDLRPVLAEQGLQGIYYVDPSVYSDYGHGCAEPERLFRARLIEYVKMGSACVSCVHQNKVGFCSKINKPLVHEPPYADKLAQQREILASGDSTSIDLSNLVNNGRSMLAEFQMANEMTVEVNDVPVQTPLSVEFGTGKVKL